MRRSRSLLFLFALMASTACYRSVPIEPGVVTPGREVVLELTPNGSLELAPQLGAQLVSVTGRLGDVTGSRYVVSVRQTNARGGIETLWKGEQANIPKNLVTQVFERRIDKKRSWMVAGLTVVGVVLAGEAFGINTGLDGFISGGGRGDRK